MKGGYRKLKTSSGIADVPGFQVAGVGCDVRNLGNDRLDLALIHSHLPCTAAGVFTRNAFAAAPVRNGRKILLEEKKFHGILTNSGNANACTGAGGMSDTLSMQAQISGLAGRPPSSYFVCSTGRIGEPLPMLRISRGIDEVWESRASSQTAGERAADAILTSDTRRKVVTFRIQTNEGPVTLSGMAKGAGMIEPNMATMLAFFATDARIPKSSLQKILRAAVNGTFNAVTVDGDRSTNDTVLVLANGASGIRLGPSSGADWKAFVEALQAAAYALAEKIVGDGEKITKVVRLNVTGAPSAVEAERVARAVGNSLLVKTSWFGNDPNWGRVLDAVGYADPEIDPDVVKMDYRKSPHHQAVPVFRSGAGLPENKPRWKKIVSEKHFQIDLDLGQGTGRFLLLASDLTEGYVNFNKSE